MAVQTVAQLGGIVVSPEEAKTMTKMQSMASKMWAPFLVMGFMIVVISLIIGAVNASVAADYFDFDQETRGLAGTGSNLAEKKAFIEATKAWLPGFQFLGMGMILGGITFALATILGNLKVGGGRVQEAIGKGTMVIKPPMTAKMFPMLMMMGMMVLMATLIIGIVEAAIAADYWDHSIANELNVAPEGSDLLSDLGTIQAVGAWLAPLKFVGLALLLSGITLALATIVKVLRFQTTRVVDLIQE
ncbi:MAG: hypothetical protein V3U90_07835 [Dehalococcoidia bacterium]